ncbi:MAG: hypothetical protein M3162_01665 [Thermoproteota archaeon]|nr:hypothetical protein [Thermoproteota archaeon]
MNKNNAIVVTLSIIAVLMIASPALASLSGDQMADATKKKKSGKFKQNEASQEILQSQSSSQSSTCVSGVASVLCGNNLNFQIQANTGNNALGQR